MIKDITQIGMVLSKATAPENMEHFCLQNSKLKWTGSLCDLKVFVLTEIDEETAKNATWISPSGGTWTSKAICYQYLGKLYFKGRNGEDLTERICSYVHNKVNSTVKAGLNLDNLTENPNGFNGSF